MKDNVYYTRNGYYFDFISGGKATDKCSVVITNASYAFTFCTYVHNVVLNKYLRWFVKQVGAAADSFLSRTK